MKKEQRKVRATQQKRDTSKKQSYKPKNRKERVINRTTNKENLEHYCFFTFFEGMFLL